MTLLTWCVGYLRDYKNVNIELDFSLHPNRSFLFFKELLISFPMGLAERERESTPECENISSALMRRQNERFLAPSCRLIEIL